jgi:hypothetical protein
MAKYEIWQIVPDMAMRFSRGAPTDQIRSNYYSVEGPAHLFYDRSKSSPKATYPVNQFIVLQVEE